MVILCNKIIAMTKFARLKVSTVSVGVSIRLRYVIGLKIYVFECHFICRGCTSFSIAQEAEGHADRGPEDRLWCHGDLPGR